MKIFQRTNLKIRVFLLAVLTGGVSLFALSGILIFLESHDSQVLYEVSLSNSTVQAGRLIGRSPFMASEEARNILRTLRINPQVVGSALFDKKGHRIAADFPPSPQVRPLLPGLSGGEKLSGIPVLRYQNPHNLFAKGNTLGILVPLTRGRESTGWLQVNYSLTSLCSQITERIRLRILFGLLGILLACGIFYRSLSRYVDTIARLKTSAQKISRGDFSACTPVLDTGDEIAELAATFNQMTANLQQFTNIEKEAAAHAATAELERKRTSELEEFQKASLNIMDDLNARSRELGQALHELRQTQGKLVQSGKMAALGQFGAGVAHELNQALGGIKGFTQILLSEFSPDDRRYQDLKTIEEQADRMARIVRNIRGFAKKGELTLAPIPITQPLDDAFMLVTAQLDAHNIRIDRDISADLPPILGDSQQLQQVFLNLIANSHDAIAARPEKLGGEIGVAACVRGTCLEIQFRDTGTGIKPEHLSEIFNPFFSTKPSGQGTGLGLALSYGIIQAHKGEIAVASQWGNGTTFTIKLPLAVVEKHQKGGLQ